MSGWTTQRCQRPAVHSEWTTHRQSVHSEWTTQRQSVAGAAHRALLCALGAPVSAMQDYVLYDEIGFGSLSVVYKGRKTVCLVAVGP